MAGRRRCVETLGRWTMATEMQLQHLAREMHEVAREYELREQPSCTGTLMRASWLLQALAASERAELAAEMAS